MEFLRYPHLISTFFNRCEFGPPPPFTAASTWTWVGHPVSGLCLLTWRPIKTRFPFGSGLFVLNLASNHNSPDRSTKSTPLHILIVLRQFVGTEFQVLFHSPPGVLFTFPSQYYALSVTKKYLALRGGPRSFRQGFSCLVLLWILPGDLGFRIRGFHSLRPDFPVRSPILRLPQRSPNPAMHASRFGLFPFRSPLLWKSIDFLSLPPGT